MRCWVVLLIAGLFVASSVHAEEQETVAPSARRGDVESVDAILHAVYDVISGPAGQKRDWDRFRSLFVPGAKLIPASRQEGSERIGHSMLSPEDYIERAGPRLETDGFFESEIHRVTEQFGPIAHVFSTYESRRAPGDEKPFARGINSFQLLNDGERWWVVNIFWTAERPDLPIPSKYLR